MAKVVRFSAVNGEVFFGERKLSEGDEIRPTGSIGFFKLESGRLVRYSGSGQRQYRFSFRGDGEYKAGPAFAHKVKRPEAERDPIKRVLRELDIPSSRLRRMKEGETLHVSEESRNLVETNWPEGSATYVWSTNGRRTSTHKEGGRLGPYGHYHISELTIEESRWAVCRGAIVNMNGSLGSRLWKVVVWPGCDPAELRRVLS